MFYSRSLFLSLSLSISFPFFVSLPHQHPFNNQQFPKSLFLIMSSTQPSWTDKILAVIPSPWNTNCPVRWFPACIKHFFQRSKPFPTKFSAWQYNSVLWVRSAAWHYWRVESVITTTFRGWWISASYWANNAVCHQLSSKCTGSNIGIETKNCQESRESLSMKRKVQSIVKTVRRSDGALEQCSDGWWIDGASHWQKNFAMLRRRHWSAERQVEEAMDNQRLWKPKCWKDDRTNRQYNEGTNWKNIRSTG